MRMEIRLMPLKLNFREISCRFIILEMIRNEEIRKNMDMKDKVLDQ